MLDSVTSDERRANHNTGYLCYYKGVSNYEKNPA